MIAFLLMTFVTEIELLPVNKESLCACWSALKEKGLASEVEEMVLPYMQISFKSVGKVAFLICC